MFYPVKSTFLASALPNDSFVFTQTGISLSCNIHRFILNCSDCKSRNIQMLVARRQNQLSRLLGVHTTFQTLYEDEWQHNDDDITDRLQMSVKQWTRRSYSMQMYLLQECRSTATRGPRPMSNNNVQFMNTWLLIRALETLLLAYLLKTDCWPTDGGFCPLDTADRRHWLAELSLSLSLSAFWQKNRTLTQTHMTLCTVQLLSTTTRLQCVVLCCVSSVAVLWHTHLSGERQTDGRTDCRHSSVTVWLVQSRWSAELSCVTRTSVASSASDSLAGYISTRWTWKSNSATFVDILAMHADVCIKFYTTVKQ